MTAEALLRWLPEQRWFAGRSARSVRIERTQTLLDGDPGLSHVVVVADGRRYQVLLGHRTRLPEHLADAWICDDGGKSVYAATRDADLMSRLLGLWRPELGVGDLPARLITAEQSNTSLVLGERYILKLFRRLLPGAHPDVDLHRALTEVGSGHIARLVGSVSTDLHGEPTTLGILQEFLPDAVDGWTLATASAARPHERGSFVWQVRDLGRAVATVHADLATAFGTAKADLDLDRMHRRLTEALVVAPELALHETAVRAAFDRAAGASVVQRIHGDLHLGQVLRSGGRWTLIDFEGEPGAPLAERNTPRQPMQDVAAMLRSFDYAAHHRLLGSPAEGAWAARAVAAFCDGYAEVLDDPRAEPVLLRALELDKAVYEVSYEKAHRPQWSPIPFGAITRLTEGTRP
jgi:maltokinase